MKQITVFFICIMAISCDNTPQKNTIKTINHIVNTSENHASFKGEASYDPENKTIVFTDTSGTYELYKNNDFYSLFTVLRDEKAFLGKNSITVSFKGEKLKKQTDTLQVIKMSKLISITEKKEANTPQ